MRMATVEATAQRGDLGTTGRLPADEAEIDTLMRRFFVQSQVEPVKAFGPDVKGVDAQGGAPRRDFDMATELLDRASQAFDLLMDRCQGLEHDLDSATEQARVRGAEQEETIEQWKRLASSLKAQIDTAEQASTALKTRCDTAEARAAMAEQRANALERASAQAAAHAALAERLSTKLHDKVVSAFGIGSRAHPMLEVVATQQAAE